MNERTPESTLMGRLYNGKICRAVMLEAADRIEYLVEEKDVWKKKALRNDRRIEELEALISQGFQDLKGRDVADSLIDNANLSERIAELEEEIRILRELHRTGDKLGLKDRLETSSVLKALEKDDV